VPSVGAVTDAQQSQEPQSQVPEPTRCDVLVLGVGSGGEVVAERAARGGLDVVAVESWLVGGECPYVACVPSKAMLLAAAAHRDSASDDHQAAWRKAVDRRDEAAEHRDDSAAAQGIRDAGARLVRGRGRLDGRDRKGCLTVVVEADGSPPQWFSAASVVVDTGSSAVVPPVEGLADAGPWTSDDALASGELPERLLLMGGGPVGVELAQVYASFGTRVTLVEGSPTLVSGEPDWAGELLAEALRDLGADVRTGTTVERVGADGGGLRVTMDDGSVVHADRLLVATGRRPRSSDLGLEPLGVGLADDGSVPTDARCRVLDDEGAPVPGLYAIGDVTGLAPYTHTATYQGRLVAAHLLGHGRDAVYAGVPRAVYTTPALHSVGLTADAAREQGRAVETVLVEVSDTARSFLEQPTIAGRLELVADAGSGALLGATVVAPDADGWAAELGLAVRCGTSVHVLADHIRPFPSWQESLQPAAEELSDRISGSPRVGGLT
jgi:pyruvate/2-oxoglutarate dehydrogenase complex dihydrolipoamide dehydrogenase (E3) component